MKSLHFLNMIFAKLLGEKCEAPVNFFLHISPLKFFDLVLIPDTKLDGHRGTWTGCLYLIPNNCYHIGRVFC